MFSRRITDYGEPTGYVNLIQVVQYKLEDFFVSDVAPDELYVSTTIWAEFELEVEFHARLGAERDRYDRNYRPRRRRSLGDYVPDWHSQDDYERWERRASECECIYPCVRLEVQLDVVAEDLKDVSISSMELV